MSANRPLAAGVKAQHHHGQDVEGHEGQDGEGEVHVAHALGGGGGEAAAGVGGVGLGGRGAHGVQLLGHLRRNDLPRRRVHVGHGNQAGQGHVQQGRNGQEEDKPDQQGARPPVVEQEQHQAEHRVEQEDVARPEQVGVDEPEAEQDEHPAEPEAPEARAAAVGALGLQRHAQAEQEAERGVELALGEECDEPACQAIQRGLARGRADHHVVDRLVEQGHVHQEDPEDREAAQDVDGGHAPVGGEGCHQAAGRWRGRRGRVRLDRESGGLVHGFLPAADGRSVAWTVRPAGLVYQGAGGPVDRFAAGR